MKQTVTISYTYDHTNARGKRFVAYTPTFGLAAHAADYHAAKAELIEMVRDKMKQPANEEIEVEVAE